VRTRIFNKMTTPEVEAYLARGGDTMFIAVGVTECHGSMPIDCETIYPEAIARLLAEKADGLAMINLPYFYPGGTVISSSTVHFSIQDGISYLRKICKSLVDQGFKRLFLVTGHGPASLTLNAFCRDFFEETLIHPCHISNASGKPQSWDLSPEGFRKMLYPFYGAYKIMNQMEYIPVDPDYVPNGTESATEGPLMVEDPVMKNFSSLVRNFGGVASLMYSDPSQHGGGIVFRSEEERLAVCTEGEDMLRATIAESPICELKEALGEYQDYVQRVYQNFPRIKNTKKA